MTVFLGWTFFFLTSELAGWIAGVFPTSCSSLTTPGTPFIPRRQTSNSNSRVSFLLYYQFSVVPSKANCKTVDWLEFCLSLKSLLFKAKCLTLILSKLFPSVWDGGVHAVGSAAPRTHLSTPQRPAALHLHVCFGCTQSGAHWPLGAASWQTSCRNGNVPRFSNHPLWAYAPSTYLNQGAVILDFLDFWWYMVD